MAPRSPDARDPALLEALQRHRACWVPVFLARAGHGLTTVVVVGLGVEGGDVALLSPVEASALLKRLGDNRGAARVAGTATPGAAWAVGVLPAGPVVWSLSLAGYFSG